MREKIRQFDNFSRIVTSCPPVTRQKTKEIKPHLDSELLPRPERLKRFYVSFVADGDTLSKLFALQNVA